MINEKMLELNTLLYVSQYVSENWNNKWEEDSLYIEELDTTISIPKIEKRTSDLLREFLNPYVIDNAPKGE